MIAQLKFCKACNTDTERGNQGRCIPCTLAAQAKYRKAHPDRTRQAQQRWRAKTAPKPRVSREEYNTQRREIYAATAEQRAVQKIERDRLEALQRRRESHAVEWEIERLAFEADPACLLTMGSGYATEGALVEDYARFRNKKGPEHMLWLDIRRLDSLAGRDEQFIGIGTHTYKQEQRYLLWASAHPEQAAIAEQRALAAIAERDDYSDLV